MWSPDGTWLASAGGDLAIRLREPASGTSSVLEQHLPPMTRREVLESVERLLRRMEAWYGWSAEATN
jgi:hypothetical protein